MGCWMNSLCIKNCFGTHLWYIQGYVFAELSILYSIRSSKINHCSMFSPFTKMIHLVSTSYIWIYFVHLKTIRYVIINLLSITFDYSMFLMHAIHTSVIYQMYTSSIFHCVFFKSVVFSRIVALNDNWHNKAIELIRVIFRKEIF